jgi:hypothetical protein
MRVRVELEGKTFDMEGPPAEVQKALIKWLCQAMPTLELVSRVIYSPDLDQLSEALAGLAGVTSEGDVFISSEQKLSTMSAICLCLAAAYLGDRMGKLSSSSLSKSGIASCINKGLRDVERRLSDLKKARLVKAVDKDEYQITELGIKHLLEEIIPRLRKG